MSFSGKMRSFLKSPRTCMFAAGVLFGTAGIKLLSSRDAKTVYSHATAAALRAKDSVMKTATAIQENCEDIYADALAINEDRALEEELLAEYDKDLEEAAEEEEEGSDAVSDQT